MNVQELIDFENEIRELFNQDKILSPVHFSSGNEQELIEIFKEIKPTDWVCSTHRSHYHAFLKGIPPDWIKQEILNTHSMHLSNKEYRFFSSAIVGGNCPIALGIAMALRIEGSKDHVYCFSGDMASRTGIFYESVRFAEGHDLPVTFIVEDNGLSVNTPTSEVWGERNDANKIRYYNYKMLNGHSGTGHWVKF